MIKKNLYRYVGRNGFITSEIYLEGAQFFPMYRLIAENGKILTKDGIKTKSVDVFPEDIDKWKEIDDGQ